MIQPINNLQFIENIVFRRRQNTYQFQENSEIPRLFSFFLNFPN